jgi:hypothetical protein
VKNIYWRRASAPVFRHNRGKWAKNEQTVEVIMPKLRLNGFFQSEKRFKRKIGR